MKKVISVFFAVLFVFAALTVTSSAAVAKDGWSTTCPYCGETFTSEKDYAAHMKEYNFTNGHYQTCPYTGDDYKDGGCGESFATKDAYDYHVAHCPHEGDYSTIGYLKYFGGKLWESVKGVDWGTLFSSIVAIVKALVKGIDFGEIVSTVKGMF